MKSPPQWSAERLEVDASASCRLFRHERLDEPLERWKATFNQYEAQFHRLFDEYGIASPESLTPERVAEIFRDELGDVLRYLAGPPISADDLKVLADASLAPGRLAADSDQAQRVLDTILQAVDPCRFPWVIERRAPSDTEKSAAILASAALITAQRISTERRNKGKREQELTVKRYLEGIGLKEVAKRTIRTLADAPSPGQYCGESMVGSRKADIPVRLYDGRLMPIECKVSNSYTNSVKRLNNDAAVKAGIWRREFGTNQIVPVAVLSGLFKLLNLEQAQTGNLTLFWAHELRAMGTFITATKSS